LVRRRRLSVGRTAQFVTDGAGLLLR